VRKIPQLGSVNSTLYGPAMGVPQDHDQRDPGDLGGKLQAAPYILIDHVSGRAGVPRKKTTHIALQRSRFATSLTPAQD
jgi:hypothetical protein